jgi:hypothetical protein
MKLNLASILSPYETTMLVCGVVLFLFALGLVAYLVRKDRSFTGAITLLVVALVMIGFPAIQHFQISAEEISFDKETSTALRENPTDVAAANTLRGSLRKLDADVAKSKNQTLPANVVSELKSTVQTLAQHPNLPPETRIAQAHAQLLLGDAKDAATTLGAALRAKPSLEAGIDPKLMAVAQADLRSWLNARKSRTEPAPVAVH